VQVTEARTFLGASGGGLLRFVLLQSVNPLLTNGALTARMDKLKRLGEIDPDKLRGREDAPRINLHPNTPLHL